MVEEFGGGYINDSGEFVRGRSGPEKEEGGEEENKKLSGNQGLDKITTALADAGVSLPDFQLAIDDVRQAIRNPDSSTKAQANASLDILVQEMHDRGIDLIQMQKAIQAARQGIHG